MREAGFVDLVCFPSLVTLDRPGRPIWCNREDHILSLLSPEELPVWQAERDRAEAEGCCSWPTRCIARSAPGRVEERSHGHARDAFVDHGGRQLSAARLA